TLQACVESSFNGSIYDMRFQVELPEGVDMVLNSGVLHYYEPHHINDFVSSALQFSSNGNNIYTVDLIDFNNPPANPNFDNGLSGGEIICMEYTIRPQCNFAGTLRPIVKF